MTRVMRILPFLAAMAACGLAEGDGARASEQAPPPHPVAAALELTDRFGEAVPTDGFSFVPHRTQAGVADSVFVIHGGRRVQTLVPSELLMPGYTPHAYRLDLDFDGHQDFAFLTFMPAAPNPSYDYWRLDPAAGRFSYVGNHEMFEPDSAERVLFTHARGGHAGRTWSNSRWRWVDGKLVEFWRGEQTYADDVRRYVYSESGLRAGKWVVVKADTLDDAEVEPAEDPASTPGA